MSIGDKEKLIPETERFKCHPKPKIALCDGPQALTMQEIDHFIADVEIVRRAYKERKALAEKD